MLLQVCGTVKDAGSMGGMPSTFVSAGNVGVWSFCLSMFSLQANSRAQRFEEVKKR